MESINESFNNLSLSYVSRKVPKDRYVAFKRLEPYFDGLTDEEIRKNSYKFVELCKPYDKMLMAVFLNKFI